MTPEQSTQQEPEVPKLTMANTKKEMLAAYKDLVKQLQQKRQAEMKPEQRIKEKEERAAVQVADSLSMEGVAREIGNLKSEIGRMLAQLSDKMEEAIGKYLRTKQAVEVKEKELDEIYEIQKTASTLTALLEVQKTKREQFDADMAEQKEELEAEIEATREEWQEEAEAHKAEVKERDDAEKKKREREAEEYKYKLAREKKQLQEEFEYDKAKLERDMQLKKEELEGDLGARQKALAEREAELSQLRQKADAFPQELEAAVNQAVQEAAARLNQEAQAREELLKKDAQGEQKVLQARIQSLQQAVKEQADHIARLSAQLDKSYGQVQDIAVKAIEGSANVQALASLQRQAAEPPRRQAKEES